MKFQCIMVLSLLVALNALPAPTPTPAPALIVKDVIKGVFVFAKRIFCTVGILNCNTECKACSNGDQPQEPKNQGACTWVKNSCKKCAHWQCVKPDDPCGNMICPRPRNPRPSQPHACHLEKPEAGVCECPKYVCECPVLKCPSLELLDSCRQVTPKPDRGCAVCPISVCDFKENGACAGPDKCGVLAVPADMTCKSIPPRRETCPACPRYECERTLPLNSGFCSEGGKDSALAPVRDQQCHAEHKLLKSNNNCWGAIMICTPFSKVGTD
jgi:hypothetical protein